MNPSLNTQDKEALITRWLDDALLPGDAAAVEQLLATDPDLAAEADSWKSVQSILQAGLPREIQPPNADFFTSQILSEIAPPAVRNSQESPAKAKTPWWQSLRLAWMAPLAATAAVLVAGAALHWRKDRLDTATAPYSPDPSVKASLAFNDEANATVLDLDNLQLEDSMEIRPFSVASSDEFVPGMPQRFYAANNPSQHVFTLGFDLSMKPIILVKL